MRERKKERKEERKKERKKDRQKKGKKERKSNHLICSDHKKMQFRFHKKKF